MDRSGKHIEIALEPPRALGVECARHDDAVGASMQHSTSQQGACLLALARRQDEDEWIGLAVGVGDEGQPSGGERIGVGFEALLADEVAGWDIPQRLAGAGSQEQDTPGVRPGKGARDDRQEQGFKRGIFHGGA
jgi:hypothetical protein